MSDREKLAQLHSISQLMLDIKLLALDKAATARQASLDHLAGLNRPCPSTDLGPVLAGEVEMRYQHWADQRRAAINLDLARQTADWTEAKRDAALAFGRNSAIEKLKGRAG